MSRSPKWRWYTRTSRERSDELQGLAGSRSSQAREILARLIETAVGSRKRQRPPEHSTPARTQIARLRKLKFARQQQWQQQHQQQQLAHHVQKLATAGPAPTITSVGVVDGAAVVDCGAVGAGAGGDAERRQLSWLQKERARETARELRTLRHDVSARGIGAELQGVLQMTSAGNADGHSQLAPPERLGELQSLRRSSRVSGLLERSGFRRGLETMLQAMPAPGSQSGTSVSPTTTIVPARFAPPPWQHQHQQQHEQDTHRHRQDAEVAPMVMPVSPWYCGNTAATCAYGFWSRCRKPPDRHFRRVSHLRAWGRGACVVHSGGCG